MSAATMGHVALVAIAGTTVQVPIHIVKSFGIRFPLMKFIDAQSSNELQWPDTKIGHQDSSSAKGHYSDMPHSWYVRSVSASYQM